MEKRSFIDLREHSSGDVPAQGSLCVILALLICLFPNFVRAQDSMAQEQKPPQTQCETEVVTQDLEERYLGIQKKLEEDYNQGVPKKLKSEFLVLRKKLDDLNLKFFEIDSQNSQEINFMAQKILTALDDLIVILPKASRLAPTVRDQFVVPFTNINSIIAENQDCLMKLAVAEAQKEMSQNPVENSSGNIYKKLTSELKALNENLYKLETTDAQKFVSLKDELLKDLEAYNDNKDSQFKISANLPQMINAMQAEIERVIPGLELSKKYFSIAH